jgi:hypothetical protein
VPSAPSSDVTMLCTGVRGRGILRSTAIRVAPVPVQPDGRGTIRFVTFTERPQQLTVVFDGA